ncbi:PREDICTED: molybdopterin synthase catalytic subunit-like, partial [Tinamus guttatus]|uniref:molybdopterin synthase catalytic subunit-like n=1 Tax=Tinamus guttatus TaxID=94827 RepID=UPI00052F0D2B
MVAPCTARSRRLSPVQVTVLYFARSVELVGLRSKTLCVLLSEDIMKLHPRLAAIWDQGVFAVWQEYVLLGDQLLVLHPEDELITCSCLGTTRNNFEGKKVIRLEYEAYTSMAETEIKKICRDVRQKWPSVQHIAVHHRLGNNFGASVIIAVSSPHRAESLEAVRYCINTLKASVPIWKKEIYEDEYSWKENKE